LQKHNLRLTTFIYSVHEEKFKRCSLILKHDQYVQELFEKLKDNYDVIYRSLPLFSERNRLIGEIDMVGVSSYGVDIFEVKCSFRPVKAKKQLLKIRKIFGQNDKDVNAFFYHGAGEQLVRID
jgi:hypothetical protein